MSGSGFASGTLKRCLQAVLSSGTLNPSQPVPTNLTDYPLNHISTIIDHVLWSVLQIYHVLIMVLYNTNTASLCPRVIIIPAIISFVVPNIHNHVQCDCEPFQKLISIGFWYINHGRQQGFTLHWLLAQSPAKISFFWTCPAILIYRPVNNRWEASGPYNCRRDPIIVNGTL